MTNCISLPSRPFFHVSLTVRWDLRQGFSAKYIMFLELLVIEMNSKKLYEIAVILGIIGIVWSFSIGKFCIGDSVLRMLGLKAWSYGDIGVHYAIYYGLIFWIPAVIILLVRKLMK